MTGPVFVDTNVLVYARDASEPDKQQRANGWMSELWASRRGRLSYQVLTEFYVTTTRKLRPGLEPAEAESDVRALTAWNPVAIDLRVFEAAWQAQALFSLSWWDALIVAAAQVSRCRYLLTEDLHAGQDLAGVRVVSPFETSPSEI